MKRKIRILAAIISICIFAFVAMPAAAAETDAKVQAADMVKQMTLEQKLGQMIMPAFRTWTDASGATTNVTAVNPQIADAIKEYGFGGIILFAENLAGTRQTTELICDMQTTAMADDSLSGIPLLMAVDQEGGNIVRLNTGTDTCGNMALAATGSTDMTTRSAAIIGSELAAEGFNIDFAPVSDVNNNPNNPIIGVRSFSDDPQTVADHTKAFIAGLHSENVASALKHFPGHGDTATDSHSGLPSINKNLEQLTGCELIPFRAGIAAGADVIMTAHIQFPRIEKATYTSVATGEKIYLPATLSRTMITDILRGELVFDGVVCTDAMEMEAIAKHFDRLDAARFAINAGVDILLMPVNMSSAAGIDDCGTYIAAIADMVRSGEIAESTIDAAVTRILTLKIERGIMDTTIEKQAQVAKALATVGSVEHHEEEWEIAKQAVTMVKNNGVLPLRLTEKSNIALFCAYGNEVNSMQFAIDRLKKEGVIPAAAKCSVFCYRDHTIDDFAAEINAADAIIASLETGKTSDITGGWQAEFLDSLIARTHELGKKITVISIQLPYDLARYQEADALLAAYCSKGMNTMPTKYEGETVTYGANLPAAVYAAFGGCIPGGKLPVNIPALDNEHNYTSRILYPRGYAINSWTRSAAFTDVPEDSYFTPAVNWALENDITGGTSSVTFSPFSNCNRGQAVTFLWRAAGKPYAETESTFTDVSPESYYAQAVSWAAAEGITSGTTATTFSPEATVTRGQMVTFLFRYADGKAATGVSAFDDVPQDAYYAEAVSWAAANAIVSGTSATTFSPDAVCQRAHTVTFLYRLLAE